MTKEGKDEELTDEVTETRNVRAQPTITSIDDERSQTSSGSFLVVNHEGVRDTALRTHGTEY